jgi:hypothetical protein
MVKPFVHQIPTSRFGTSGNCPLQATPATTTAAQRPDLNSPHEVPVIDLSAPPANS